MQNARTKAEAQIQRTKLTNSYNELLEEFSSGELRSVGNYTLGKLVGKGSFGKVYLATHKLTNGSKVVLKSAKKNDPNLAREIHHHRQFLHPHIARLYEVIVTENLVWLVLEYCPGDELYNYLLHRGALPTEKVQRIFAQLVGAVSYVHNKNCVHRDLKLENILLDKHENVKLCDFGFTREYEKMKNHLQTFCGTVCYSAPEMLKGEKYAGEKVDIWSLGIILFSLLAGELPFDEDDELATKHKILNTEPKYPDTMPADAKALIARLLSKRPLVRPSLFDILSDPFLVDYAPAQQAILKLARPAPFTTPLEKDTLQRMRSAGIDIDKVIENVLAQRMDALGGWWALLIEKEDRKEARRERKRREREQEIKSLRRISAASSRMTPTLRDVDEEGGGGSASLYALQQQNRGRTNRRSLQSSQQIVIPELPKLPEGTPILTPGTSTPPPPVEKDFARSGSSSRHRPPVPSKDQQRRRSRGSTLQLVTANPDLLMPPPAGRRRRRHPNPLLNQLSSLKHWIAELPRRARSPHSSGRAGSENAGASLKAPSSKSLTPQKQRGGQQPAPGSSGTATRAREAKPAARVESPHLASPVQHTPRSAAAAARAYSRQSLSPAPLTPHSSVYRRSSAGLRGRKSTSSSVSSVRSIHHVHTHSKTSSTSSNAASSVHSAALAAKALPRSPHSSVKVLPATPTAGSFPPGIRVARGAAGPPAPLNLSLAHAAFDGSSPAAAGAMPSPGLVFAKRKKTPFRGPMLSINSPSVGGGGARSREGSVGRRSTSVPRGRGGITITEEDEGEGDEDDDIEEVDAFSPVGEREVVMLETEDGVEEEKGVVAAALPPAILDARPAAARADDGARLGSGYGSVPKAGGLEAGREAVEAS